MEKMYHNSNECDDGKDAVDNQTRDLVWIVVIDADEDFDIDGKDAVDNDDDVEIIKDSDLREEIRAERREDEKFMRRESARRKAP